MSERTGCQPVKRTCTITGKLVNLSHLGYDGYFPMTSVVEGTLGSNFVAKRCRSHLCLSHSPCGKKFRSKPQIQRFLGDNADLTCFDFSRAGTPGDGTQRRRARDRSIKRVSDLPRVQVPLVRPLTNNPLRPSGPIRRTCGVIKLPVTWVAPPNDDELKSNLIAGNPADPRGQSTINLVVQSLWEKRLFGVKPYDHMTQSEIRPQNGIIDASDLIRTAPLTPPMRKPQSPRSVGAIQPSSLLTGPQAGKSPPPSVASPPLLRQHLTLPATNSAVPRLSTSGQTQISLPGHAHPSPPNGQSHMPSSNELVVLTLQQQARPQGQELSNGPSCAPPAAASAAIETEVRLQEERVRLLRQQLLAAEGI